jgi:hypothetical protein
LDHLVDGDALLVLSSVDTSLTALVVDAVEEFSVVLGEH